MTIEIKTNAEATTIEVAGRLDTTSAPIPPEEGTKKAPPGRSVHQNLVEFRRRSDERRVYLFSGATCACRTTLLGLQTCEFHAFMRELSALQQAAAHSKESPAKRVSFEACQKHSFLTRSKPRFPLEAGALYFCPG